MEEENGNGAAADEEDLSHMISTSLTISQTKEITKIDTSSFCFPKKVHHGLYERLGKTLYVDTSLTATIPDEAPPIRNNNNGVPGFPEFPDSWCGEEGWATWQRVPPNTTNKTQRRQLAEEIQKGHQSMVLKRLRRQAVNVAGLPKRPSRTKTGYKPATAKSKTHKLDRRRKMVQQLRHRREMASLRKNLKALKCK